VNHKPARRFAVSFLSYPRFLQATCLVALASGLFAGQVRVSNVSAVPRASGSLVDVTYTLSVDAGETAIVALRVSRDGGDSFQIAPPSSIAPGSAHGLAVSAGAGKLIVWDSALQNWPATPLPSVLVEVIASPLGGMVLVPNGTYTQGSPTDELGRQTNEPQRQVTLTRSFFLQSTEVSWRQWNTVRDWALVNGYTDLAPGRKGSLGTAINTEFDPVTFVNWFDALKWLNARSEMEGYTPAYTLAGGVVYRTGEVVPTWDPAANGYRLPTEAEWERACRADTTTAYHNGPISLMGGTPPDPNLKEIGWFLGNSGSQTRPVAGRAANAWGLYDMSGNVWEWCWDRYATYGTTAVTDPTGPTTGTQRAKRSGSWGSQSQNCRSAYRTSGDPFARAWSDNFRPARNTDFVAIPAGMFTQGTPTTETIRVFNEIPRQVTLSRPYFMQRTEVTWAQWTHVRDWATAARGYGDITPGQMGHPGDAANSPLHPVTMIGWHDAVKWLNAWSEKEGLRPVYRVRAAAAGSSLGAVYRRESDYSPETQIVAADPEANGYRLPTEAQWEHAARAGSATALPNGAISGAVTDANLGLIAWYAANSNQRTQPVAGKPANAWGLHDMLGNVSEWCADWYFFDAVNGALPVVDPEGPELGSRRIYRGGSWNDSAHACRPAMRIGYATVTRSPQHGFRAVIIP
jgi:formylglycine-generating enzyme required for sulfatase activity